MIAVYDEDPLIKFQNVLENRLFSKNGIDAKEDDIIHHALANNGCSFSDNVSSTTEKITDNIYLYFIYGAKGNEFSESYDYISAYGVSYIIIFADYYNDIKTELITETDNMSIEDQANYFMGNSVYFNSICNITDLFIRLLSNVKSPSGTIQEKINISAPSIIAGSIINKIRPLQENDCDGSLIPYDKLLVIINYDKLRLALLGIF